MNATERAQENCKLSDYDIISDVLGCQKQLVQKYTTALCECSDETLRDLIKSQMSECACDQFAAFQYMNVRGMYECDCAQASEVTQMQDKFCRCAQEMNN